MIKTSEWTVEEFVSYLETTLIPDLKDSGRDATAEDFETAVDFILSRTNEPNMVQRPSSKDIERCKEAMESPSFPVNPIPFASCLAEGVRLYGTNWIQSDAAKRILFVLNGQAYGQLFQIDGMDEYSRLTAEKCFSCSQPLPNHSDSCEVKDV